MSPNAAEMEPPPDTSWAKTMEIKEYARRLWGDDAVHCDQHWDADGNVMASWHHRDYHGEPAPLPRLLLLRWAIRRFVRDLRGVFRR